MGRKYQSHDRYEENFVTVVEFIFDERHLSSSSIVGGGYLVRVARESPQAILLSRQFI
jgi:hypothetical protein